jgi:hypothetical protein
MIEYVVEGTYGVRAEASVRVIRADGTEEEIAAGTEVTLATGDALISRNETMVEAWNSGTIPTLLLNWTYLDNTGRIGGHALPGWGGDLATDAGRVPLLQGPATVTLLRATMPNGGEAAIEYPEGLRFAVHTDGNGFVTRRTDGSIRISADSGSPFVAYVLRVEPDSTGSASPSGLPEASISS